MSGNFQATMTALMIPSTEIIRCADGLEQLLVQKARLEVIAGPDQGKSINYSGGVLVIGTGPCCQLVLTDPAVSRQQCEVQAVPTGFLVRDLGSTNGTLIQGLRLGEVIIGSEVLLELGRTQIRICPLQERERHTLSAHQRFGRLWGKSPAMRRCFALLERAAQTDSTVLLEGESGTGKDAAAESIHEGSSRADQSWVVVDCGAIPANLIESELFGHEKGAFTGATGNKAGALQRADGGTIFFDEIGELEISLQPKLLRFLEKRQVQPVGGSMRLMVDVRIIAATNRNLEELVLEGKFRQDLFYRLAVLRVEMPPLRQRREDIPLLALELARQLRPAQDPLTWLDDHTLQILASYAWPGNVRELRNALERVAAMPGLPAESLFSTARAASPEVPSSALDRALSRLTYHEAKERQLAAFERHYIQTLLDEEQGVVVRAAERAGVPRQTFFRLIRKHGLREG
jgi:transcriptional regulator with PAS, ATPase and Fis domain